MSVTPRPIDPLVAGHKRFLSDVLPPREEEFAGLAAGQSPLAVFVTCSDSRVVPDLFTTTGPGDLFVCRNAGNIVPPHSVASSEGASIEYAVCALNVPHIVVCGHSHCGAMGGLLNRDGLEAVPKVRGWVDHSEAALNTIEEQGIEDSAEKLAEMVRSNVLLQLDHLMTYPYIAERVNSGDLQLHGWVYEIETGRVLAHNADSGEFAPLGSGTLT